MAKTYQCESIEGVSGFDWVLPEVCKGLRSDQPAPEDLLKKDGFTWSDKAKKALERLKKAMSEVPTLSLHDFTKSLILKTNANSSGVGGGSTYTGGQTLGIH